MAFSASSLLLVDDRFDAAFANYPVELKKRVGEVCFFQASKKKKNEWFPVLIYNPKMLTGGGVFDGWLKKAESGKPEHIVYYYGYKFEQKKIAYDYAKNNAQLVSYQEGVEKVSERI